MTKALNELPKPRVLVEVQDDKLREQLNPAMRWAGTWVHRDETRSYDWREWDALITDQPPATMRKQIGVRRRIPETTTTFFIQHRGGGEPVDTLKSDVLSSRATSGRHITNGNLSLEDERFAGLRRQLVADADQRSSQWGVTFDTRFPSERQRTSVFESVLEGPQNTALAGRYRNGGGNWNWVVPADTLVLPWLELALRGWSQQDAANFPSQPKWEHAFEWSTQDERTAIERSRRAHEEFAEAQERYATELRSAEAQLVDARAIADQGLRRLLTGSGHELASAAEAAFNLLGFTVVDMDEINDTRHEDLQVSTAGFLAITEVTGVSRGVPQEKWSKVMNHLLHYVRQPDADRNAVPWLVVNHWLKEAPDARQPLWNADFRPSIDESGGRAIEAPALYLLANAVASGQCQEAAAREFLTGSSGVLDLNAARHFVVDGSFDPERP